MVNNNSGALFLALTTLANELQVVVSRGELIEIGGSFRLPELMAAAGAWLMEVESPGVATRSVDARLVIPEKHPNSAR